MDQGFQKLEP